MLYFNSGQSHAKHCFLPESLPPIIIRFPPTSTNKIITLQYTVVDVVDIVDICWYAWNLPCLVTSPMASSESPKTKPKSPTIPPQSLPSPAMKTIHEAWTVEPYPAKCYDVLSGIGDCNVLWMRKDKVRRTGISKKAKTVPTFARSNKNEGRIFWCHRKRSIVEALNTWKCSFVGLYLEAHERKYVLHMSIRP